MLSRSIFRNIHSIHKKEAIAKMRCRWTSQQGQPAVYGLTNTGTMHYNLTTTQLYEHVIRNHEAQLSSNGPIVTKTGAFTGRAAKDKFVVEDETTKKKVWWNASTAAIDIEKYIILRFRMMAFLQARQLYVQDCYLGADPVHRIKIRTISECAWHSLFARTMFIIPPKEDLVDFQQDVTIIHAPSFRATPEIDGTKTEAFVVASLPGAVGYQRKSTPFGTILVGGTAYAGEIKKSAFGVLNYQLPLAGVLPMHAAANVDMDNENCCVFFGLSGTGKTTLSTDPERRLIGDDEHGWGDHGVFNFEGGCYAKALNLSKESEPEIFTMTERFGTILENVIIDASTRVCDFKDSSLTENTRIAYKVDQIPNAVKTGRAGHPKNLIFLTCDAFGVMPPIAKLTPEQAGYHFMSGYTAKVAGTEKGVTEPQATFSSCFGEPFMLLHPLEYAKLLAEKVKKHEVSCWLINTGWCGTPYPEGKRVPIEVSRKCVSAATGGHLHRTPMEVDEVFGFEVPTEVPGLSPEVLKTNVPRDQKEKLATLFRENWNAKFSDVKTDGFTISI